MVVDRRLSSVGVFPSTVSSTPLLRLWPFQTPLCRSEIGLPVDVAREIVRRHPARVHVERRLPTVRIGVRGKPKLHGVIGVSVFGPTRPRWPAAVTARSRPPKVKTISLM